MRVCFAEIGGEDGAGDSDLGFSKWAEKLRGGASGFVLFSKFCLLDCNCLFIYAFLGFVVDALFGGSGCCERFIRFCHSASVKRCRI